jgi:hypothetical protein
MKTLKKQLKVVALFFSVSILFQGCTVYKSVNVTLDQAVIANTKVRIKTNDNQTLKYKNVEAENGIYYGLMKYENSWVKTPINEDNIDKVQVKDKTLSTILTVAIPVVIIAGAAFLTINNAYAKTGFGPIL